MKGRFEKVWAAFRAGREGEDFLFIGAEMFQKGYEPDESHKSKPEIAEILARIPIIVMGLSCLKVLPLYVLIREICNLSASEDAQMEVANIIGDFQRKVVMPQLTLGR